MKRPLLILIVGASVLASLACTRAQWDSLFARHKKQPPPPATTEEVVRANTSTVDFELRRANIDRVMRGTIGELASPDWTRPIPVTGYGIVAGLGKNGSKECPPIIRQQLMDEIKKFPQKYQEMGQKSVKPSALLDSEETAVVYIRGRIPAGAAYDEVFDVEVEALEGTQTKSLEGGVLLPFPMQAKGSAFAGRDVRTRELAVASGPVFVSSFGRQADTRPATASDLRKGKVIGGGRNRYPRVVKLTLMSSRSYALMNRVKAVINQHFPADPPIADARSAQEMFLTIPPQYHRNYMRFLGLVAHLYLEDVPGYRMQRAQELAEIVLGREAPYSDIALCWQGIGEPVLPVIQALYNHENKPAAFWAAVTGVRLKDNLAVPVLAEFARDSGSIFRELAIQELGDAPAGVRTAEILRPLLADSNANVRLAAYEALRRQQDPAIRTITTDGGNFEIDIVDTAGEPLISASLENNQRITIFGKDLQVQPPVYYRRDDRVLTLSADAGDARINAYRRSRVSDRGGKSELPLDVATMIEMMAADSKVVAGRPSGLQLSYDYIVGAIQAMCKSNAIKAEFMFLKPRITDLYGPVEIPEELEKPEPAPSADASNRTRADARPTGASELAAHE